MSQWENTSLEEFIQDLQKRNFSQDIIEVFKRKLEEMKEKPLLKHILSSLTADELIKKEGITSYSDCLQLFNYLDELREKYFKENHCKSRKMSKIFNDPIHGHIQLHPACQMIIDTPQFQRLRDIKQLGMVCYVYPGAAHNRFEHSLGVCHLAGQFAMTLRQSQPELGITDVDVLCVEMAGLCRNIGHGPFSIYVKEFLPSIHKERKMKKPTEVMFNHLIEKNKLREKLKAYGLEDQDLLFIKEMIGSVSATGSTEWPYKGRSKEKAYLYEIVDNKRNGIDVYKWDYLARDCYHLGLKNNFDASRYMKFVRVIEVEGEMQICVRDKEVSNLYNMFYTRYTVNKFAYSHRVACGLELMLLRILQKANKHITFKGENNTNMALSDCHQDMAAFTQLTDNVFFIIANMALAEDPPEDPAGKQRWDDLKDAQNIISRIMRRDLYTCVYESHPMSLQEVKACLNIPNVVTNEEIFKAVKEKVSDENFPLNSDERVELNRSEIEEFKNNLNGIIIKKINLDFGMKEENPVERLKVYSKQDVNQARHLKKEEASRILGPVNFNEILVRVYSISRNKDLCQIIHKACRFIFSR